MMDVYKDESLTIKKAKSRNKDKFGHRSKYIAILHYKKMPDKIRTMVKATDVPKLIAKHSAVYIAIKEGNYYKLHKNDEQYTELKTLEENDYTRFVKEHNLKSIYEESIINAKRIYLK